MTGRGPLLTAPGNAEQARAWNDGDDGRRFATHADRLELSIGGYGEAFRRAADIAITDRVLDIGCGAGRTTIDAARAAAEGSARGVDLSAPLLDVARARARKESVTNVAFVHADAQVHAFEPSGADVAISRFGSMFFGDPVAAFRNVARALVPGGRLALLSWQPFARQEWLCEFASSLGGGRDIPSPPVSVPGPFGLAEPERVEAILRDAGFREISPVDVRAPMWFGDGVDDARGFVLAISGWMLDGLDDDARERALDVLDESLVEHRTRDGVRYESAAWLTVARRA
jgi:SAM-dependent methyltransferase